MGLAKTVKLQVLVEGSSEDAARVRGRLDPKEFDVIQGRELTHRLAASIDELERQRASVLQLNQLKNDLIAVLAHDIKGPLTSIAGFAELLEEGFLEGAGAIDAAHTIRINAQRLATLANDVLALSRVEHGELEIADERVELVDLIVSVAQSHLPERSITVTTSLECAFVRGDAERLRQVFDNLFRNAIKYSAEGSAIEATLAANGDTLRIDVTDHGIGITPDDLPRLFGRFVRGSNARRAKISGTGIGLFIVRMIVEHHGGSVDVKSVLDEGSTFSVVLPSFEARVSQHPMRVAIVTKDSELSRFAAYELRSRGYRVRECRELEELAHVGDLRSGDVVLADTAVVRADEVRAFAAPGTISVIGLGAGNGDGFDATLARPFLVTDLVKAITSLV